MEIQLAAAPIGYVGVQLGSSQIGMSEHFLNASEIRASLEQVSGERVAEEVGMDPLRLQARFRSEFAKNQEGSGPSQRAALRVQEELRTVAPIEVRPASAEVTTKCLDRLPSDRDDPLLPALADRPDEPLIEIDAALVEADRLPDPQSRAVEELDESPVAKCPRRRSGGGVDEPLDLRRGEDAR